MKIIINIPENVYKAAQIIKSNYQNVIQIPLDSIRNGVVIPKGHGDLIDRDELKSKYAGWYNLATDKSIKAVLVSELYCIEPVIKADGGGKE